MNVLLLVSGGIDSPVAGRVLQESGHSVAGVHFGQTPFTDDSPERKSRACADRLGIAPLHVIEAGAAFGELAKTCEHRLYFVLMKRFMLRAAGDLARAHGYEALATGENLGQVSSQTMRNLTVIHGAATLPILTPLLSLDKQEIISIAREIGTLEMSTGPEMCDALGPDHPETMARMEHVLAEEAKVEMGKLVREAVASVSLAAAR